MALPTDLTPEAFSADLKKNLPGATLSDYGRNLLVGGVDSLQNFNEMKRRLGYAGTDRKTQSLTEAQNALLEGMTEGGKRAAQGGILEHDPNGGLRFGETPWQSALMMAARSAPSAAEALLYGGPVAKGLSTVIKAPVAAERGIAALVRREAPSAIGVGGVGQGVQAGLAQSRQVRDDIMGMDEQQLFNSTEYQQLLQQGMDHDTAVRRIADQAATDAGVETALSTGAIGILAGGGAEGMLVKHQLGREAVKDGIFKSAAKGVGKEALEEAPQSAAEEYIRAKTMQDYADPGIDPMRDVLKSGIEGGIVGGITGGVVGAVPGAMNTMENRKAKAQQAAIEQQAAQEQQAALDRQDAQGSVAQSPVEAPQEANAVDAQQEQPPASYAIPPLYEPADAKPKGPMSRAVDSAVRAIPIQVITEDNTQAPSANAAIAPVREMPDEELGLALETLSATKPSPGMDKVVGQRRAEIQDEIARRRSMGDVFASDAMGATQDQAEQAKPVSGPLPQPESHAEASATERLPPISHEQIWNALTEDARKTVLADAGVGGSGKRRLNQGIIERNARKEWGAITEANRYRLPDILNQRAYKPEDFANPVPGLSDSIQPAVERQPVAEDVTQEPGEIAGDTTTLSQDAYANVLREKGLPDGVSAYDALTARNEYRGMNAAQRVGVYQENEDKAKSFTEMASSLWGELRKNPLEGVKPIGRSSGWTNFEVGEDTHRRGADRYKSYATLRDFIDIKPEEVSGFLKTLREAGYNGQVKLPGTGARAILAFDNIVMHGASEADALLGELAARQHFGDRVTGTQFGIDPPGKSHTQALADQVEQDIKNGVKQAPSVQNEKTDSQPLSKGANDAGSNERPGQEAAQQETGRQGQEGLLNQQEARDVPAPDAATNSNEHPHDPDVSQWEPRPEDMDAKKIEAGYAHRTIGGLSGHVQAERSGYMDAVRRFRDALATVAKNDAQKAKLDEFSRQFAGEYVKRRHSVLDVGSSVASAAVSGRANFNAKQAARRGNALDRAEEDFASWKSAKQGEAEKKILEMRTPAELAEEESSRKEKENRANRRAASFVRNAMGFKHGDDLTIAERKVQKVSFDKEGYPKSITLSGENGEKNKVDIAETVAAVTGKAKTTKKEKWERLRKIVDDVRAENGSGEQISHAGNSAKNEELSQAKKTQEQQSKAQEAKTTGEDNRPYSIAKHKDVYARITDGSIGIDELRDAFNRMRDNKEDIKQELSGMTKDAIFKAFPSISERYKNEKKSDVVDAAYQSMVSYFVLGDSVSYGMNTRYADAVAKMVENYTDEDIKVYSAAIAERRKEQKEWLDKAREGVKNPQNLDDFRRYFAWMHSEGKSIKEARFALTPAQREAYDRISAIESMQKRKDYADRNKPKITEASEQVGSKIVETKHTKTGEDLFVVVPDERVDREVYNQWKGAAKPLGGWYSSFRGQGAVPGFQFKTRENAESFLQYLGGDTEKAQEAAQQKRDAYAENKNQSTVERLSTMADRMDADANDSLNADRKVNTARRARMAESSMNAAEQQKALAQTMRNIAKGIQDGTLQFLNGVRQKVQVERLDSLAKTAQYAKGKALFPDSYEKQMTVSMTPDVADYAEFPTYKIFRSDLATIGRQMIGIEGFKQLAASINKVADDVTDAYKDFAKKNLGKVARYGLAGGSMAVFPTKQEAENALFHSNVRGKAFVLSAGRGKNYIILSPSEAVAQGLWEGDGDKQLTLTPEFAEQILGAAKKIEKRMKVSLPWGLEATMQARKRLDGMNIKTPQELRAALREFITMRKTPEEMSEVKKLEISMAGRANDGLDFFPTPAETAQTMVDSADIEPGMAVLEPSAGMGHIAELIRDTGVEPDVIEFSNERHALLEAKGFRSVGRDFMEAGNDGFGYGDVYRAKDGALGVMRGSAGMGSDRVGFQPLDGNGNPDSRISRWENRDALEPVEKRSGIRGYDRIIMNPPFSNRRDIAHVRHAYELLKPGGRIVALMGEGSFFGSDKKATEFREWLESVGGTSEKLASGTFNDPSLPVNTGASARMVIIDKPNTREVQASLGTNKGKTSSLASLKDAFRKELPGLSDALDRMLERGEKGLRGGIVVSANLQELSAQYAEKTGIALPDAERIFSSQNGIVRGVYEPKSGMIFINRSAVTPETFPGIVLHEAMHGRQRADLDAKAQALLDGRGKIPMRKETRAFLDRVAQRMGKIGETGNTKETGAYIVERAMAEGRQVGFSSIDGKFMDWVDSALGKRVGGIIRNFVAMVRAWAMRSGFPIKSLAVDDLLAMARHNIKAMAADAGGVVMFSRSSRKTVLTNGSETLSRSEAIKIALAFKDVSMGGRTYTVSKNALNKMTAEHGEGGVEKPYQKERIVAIQHLPELASSAEVVYRSDDGRDPGVEKIAEGRVFIEHNGNQYLVRLLGKVWKPSTNLRDKLHSMAIEDVIVEKSGAAHVSPDAGGSLLGNAGIGMSGEDGKRMPASATLKDSLARAKPTREQYRFKQTLSSKLGPIFVGDGFVLAPAGKITIDDGETYGDFAKGGFADNSLMGHAEHVAEGAEPYKFVIFDQNRSPAGELIADVRDGVIVGIHDLDIYNQKAGLGSKIVAAIAASTNDPVNIIDEVQDAREFWQKLGSTEPDPYGNGSLDWQGVQRYLDRRRSEGKNGQNDTRIQDDARGAEGFGRNGGPQFSLAPSFDEVSDTVRSLVKEGPHKLGNMARDRLGWGLQGMARRHIADVYGKMIPELHTYGDIIEKMSAERTEGMTEADKLAERWGKLKDRDQLSDLMHDATLWQIDPTWDQLPNGRGGQDRIHFGQMKSRYARLSPEARQVFKDARDIYDAHWKKVRAELDRRLERSNATQNARDKIMAGMDARRNEMKVYFPLARFGDLVVRVSDSGGKTVSVDFFESTNQAESGRAELMRKFRNSDGFTVGPITKRADYSRSIDGIGKGVMASILDTLEASGQATPELRDDLTQLWLSTLPEVSWAKSGIHRKGTPGFHRDARRAFAAHMWHGARYLSRLRHSDALEFTLDEINNRIANEAGKEGFDAVTAQRVQDEMKKRHEFIMNPTTHPLATTATSLGFFWYLGLSPASAAVNMSQVALVAYPMLGGKFGFGKSASALTQASKETVGTINDLRKKLKGDELAAVEKAMREGVIDLTLAHELAGVASDNDRQLSGRLRPVMRWASFMYHHAERFNRQATFLAAYRLARASGQTNDAAYDAARKLTWDSQFDYSAENRPRIMQGNWQRVFLLFQQFTVNMLWALLRNGYKGLFKGDKEARRVFSGMLTMHAAFAGALGMTPLTGVLLGVASAIHGLFGDDDDQPWDAKLALRTYLEESIGKKPAEILLHGLPRAVLPGDIASRVGLDTLTENMPVLGLFALLDKQEQMDGAQGYADVVTSQMGPVVGIGASAMAGLSDMRKGHFWRGIEGMLPTAIRNPLKAIRRANEGGETDRSGVMISEAGSDFASLDFLTQVLGFRPAEIAQAQEYRRAILGIDRGLSNRHNALLRDWGTAYLSDDEEGMDSAWSEIESWNENHPTERITKLRAIQSARQRQKRIDDAVEGVYLRNSRRYLFDDANLDEDEEAA